MKVHQNIVFLSSLNLFLTNQLLEYWGYYLPYIHAYLDDILCMPVVLSFALVFQRKIVLRQADYTFTIWHIVVAVIYCALVFEWWLPKRSDIYVSDPLDILCYSIGAFIFYYWINR